jgi:hypothetical protein
MPVLEPGEIDSDGDWLDLDVMARFMEDALPPSPDPDDSGRVGRRRFLIAIASGVIGYLRHHQADGFVVHFDSSTGSLEIR